MILYAKHPPPHSTTFLCDDCAEGNHEICQRNGGWPFQETQERCQCHTHRHEPRVPLYPVEP